MIIPQNLHLVWNVGHDLATNQWPSWCLVKTSSQNKGPAYFSLFHRWWCKSQLIKLAQVENKKQKQVQLQSAMNSVIFREIENLPSSVQYHQHRGFSGRFWLFLLWYSFYVSCGVCFYRMMWLDAHPNIAPPKLFTAVIHIQAFYHLYLFYYICLHLVSKSGIPLAHLTRLINMTIFHLKLL